MLSRGWKLVVLIGFLGLLAGCDPEALVREKVPESLQNLLTFRGVGPSGGRPGKPVAVLEIVSPKAASIHAVGKEVALEAQAKIEGLREQPRLEVTWKLGRDGAAPLEIGKGTLVKKRLEAGNYTARAVLAFQEQRVEKEVAFRVAFSMPGKLSSPDPAAVAGAEILVAEQESARVVARSRADQNGAFSVDVPVAGMYVVTPQKKGASFSPMYQVIPFGGDPVKIDFSAIVGDIGNLRLAEVGEPQGSLGHACPSQDAEVFLDLNLKQKPKLLDVSLIHREADKEKPIPFEDVPDLHEVSAAEMSGPKSFKVKLPSAATLGMTSGSFHVRATVTDVQGNRYATQTTGEVKIDLAYCLRKRLADALALQEKGKPDEAAKIYAQLEDFTKNSPDPAQFAPQMLKTFFNRGVALLQAALALQPGDAKRLPAFNKAATDFSHALKTSRDDVDAMFLRALTYYLLHNYDSALKDLTSAIRIEPNDLQARRLRAITYVKTGLKKNLSPAVDDFTEALTMEPTNEALRRARAEACKLAVKYEQESGDKKVDVSSVQLPDAAEGLTLAKYPRR